MMLLSTTYLMQLLADYAMSNQVVPTRPVKVWNFVNSGRGLLTFWALNFVGAISSVIYLKLRYTRLRREVVRQKIIERHLSVTN